METTTRNRIPAVSAQYKKDYNRGWAASQRDGVSREWESGSGSDAFNSGYLDYAAGRAKWHLPACPDHDACGQG